MLFWSQHWRNNEGSSWDSGCPAQSRRSGPLRCPVYLKFMRPCSCFPLECSDLALPCTGSLFVQRGDHHSEGRAKTKRALGTILCEKWMKGAKILTRRRCWRIKDGCFSVFEGLISGAIYWNRSLCTPKDRSYGNEIFLPTTGRYFFVAQQMTELRWDEPVRASHLEH